MVVQHNILGLNANRQLNITTGIQAKSSEKLSSGYKINRAADDAAGLAISEKMRRQIRGLTQASNNCQDGVSWCQIADGALDEVDNMLERLKELSVQACNGTLTNEDRSYLDQEVQKISEEIDRVHTSTQFNEIPIFDGGMGPDGFVRNEEGSIIIEAAGGYKFEILKPFIGSDGQIAEIAETQGRGDATNGWDSELAIFVQNAAANAANQLAQAYPQLFARASSAGVQVGLDLHDKDVGNVLATASLSMTGNSTSTLMGYTMFVDTKDYPISSFPSMSAAEKADLAGVVAHEMTHLVMYDTLTKGMLGSFPDWFVEGVAQTSSGDNGWVTLKPDSTDQKIKETMAKLNTQPYGAGYLGSMYLGQLASGQSEVTSANIKDGLDKIMKYIADGHTLSEAIAQYTPYSSQAAFESGFIRADDTALAFMHDLLDARGENGAGSLLGALNQSEEDVFGNIGTVTASNYAVNREHTQFANAYGTDFDFDSLPSGSTDTPSVLYIQAGANNSPGDRIPLKRYSLSVKDITNQSGFDVKTVESANATLDVINTAAANVSTIRSYYGALQNRLEHTVKNLDNIVENTQDAESLIRDTDMAAEMVKYSNNNILAQAGQAMLAQANQTNQGVMSLLQ